MELVIPLATSIDRLCFAPPILQKHFVLLLGTGPGPLKCFCAPSHHILAKSAPQKARNRDKADFATKVRESSMNNWGTFDSKSLFKGGKFDSLSPVLTFPGGTFEDFTTTKSP